MKKLITICFTICLLLIASATALAYDGEPENEEKPSNVIITIVASEPEATEDDTATDDSGMTDGIEVYPFDVTEIREDGEWVIVKSYELINDEKPEYIPRGSFERSGWKFNLTEIVRRDPASTVSQAHSETVEISSETDNIEEILSLLSPTIEYRSEDGLYGTLTLDVSSITVERTSDYSIAGSYDVTAVYSGTIAKLTRNGTVYIAYFLGEKIEQAQATPLPAPLPADDEPAYNGSDEHEPEDVANTDNDGIQAAEISDIIDDTGNGSHTMIIVIAVAAFAAGIALSLFFKNRSKSKGTGKYRAMLLTLLLTGVVTASTLTAGFNPPADGNLREIAGGKIAYIAPYASDGINNRSWGNKEAIYVSPPDSGSPGMQPVATGVRGYA